MRRLPRILLNAATAASLAIALAIPVLWWRSYRTGDSLNLEQVTLRGGTLTQGWYALATGEGTVRYSEMRASTATDWLVKERLRFLDPLRGERLGWRIYTSSLDPGYAAGALDVEWKWLGVGLFSRVEDDSFPYPDTDRPVPPPTAHARRMRRFVRVHFAPVLAAACLLPATRFGRALWRRRRRLAPGFCPSCGYDLRATPDRCPECGRAADVATEPAQSSQTRP